MWLSSFQNLVLVFLSEPNPEVEQIKKNRKNSLIVLLITNNFAYLFQDISQLFIFGFFSWFKRISFYPGTKLQEIITDLHMIPWKRKQDFLNLFDVDQWDSNNIFAWNMCHAVEWAVRERSFHLEIKRSCEQLDQSESKRYLKEKWKKNRYQIFYNFFLFFTTIVQCQKSIYRQSSKDLK